MKLSLLKELNDQTNGGDIPPVSPEMMSDTNARPAPTPSFDSSAKVADKLSEIQKTVLVKVVLAQKAYDDQGTEIPGFKRVDLKGEQEVAAVRELQKLGLLATQQNDEIVQLTSKALGSLKQEGLINPESDGVTDPNQLSMNDLTDEAQQLVDQINNQRGNGLAQDKTAAGQTDNSPMGAAPGLPGAGGPGSSGGGGAPMMQSFKDYLLDDPKYSYLKS